MQQAQHEKKLKPQKRRAVPSRLLFVLITAVLAVYLGGQALSAFSSAPETTPAVRVTVNDSFTATGWFFRDELPVDGSTSESVKHIVYSGERVQKDAALAMVYTDEEALSMSRELEPLENRIAQLGTAMQAVADSSDAAKLDQMIALGLQQMADQVKEGKGSALASAADSLRTLSLRRGAGDAEPSEIESERSRLISERDSLQQQLAGRSIQLTAPSSGYFSEVVDGYETVLTLDALDTLTLDRFHSLTADDSRQGAASGTLGKIIRGFSWYLVAEVPVEQADRLTIGQALRVNFTQASMESPVTVYSVIKERNSETALIVLEGTEFNGEMVSLRQQPVEIILASYTGLRVPKAAIRMVDDKDGGQTTGVYILSGSIQKEKIINKLFETDDYYVVEQSATNFNMLVEQDQIVVRGKNLQNNMVVKT